MHARLRLIPKLKDDTLSGLAWHIRAVTALAIAFMVVGDLHREDGASIEDQVCRVSGHRGTTC